MQVESVALATELALAVTRGRVVDRGDCIVVETPDQPRRGSTNRLVLAEPPRADDIARWTKRFADELPAEARPYPATVADLRWVTSREFLDYDFPPADEKTMSKLLGLVRN